MKKKLITIAMATLNERDQIAHLSQSLTPFRDRCELIIIDGFSTDGTISAIQDCMPWAVTHQFKPNGIYDAYNKALEFASSDYILFMGADDRLLSDFEELLRLISSCGEEYSMVIGQSLILPDKINTEHRENPYNLISSNFCHQSIIYNRRLLGEVKYSTAYRVMADWLVNLKIQALNEARVRYVPLLISSYQKDGYSGRNRDYLWEVSHVFWKLKYLKLFDILTYAVRVKFKVRR